MKHRLLFCLALLLALPLSLARAQDSGPLQSVGDGEGALSIVAWAGYIERGETDKNYDWVTKFEQETGCKVSVKVASTSDEMVTLMNRGDFDLVTASGDASLRLVAGKQVQEINTDLIPSWKTVDDRLKEAPWHTVKDEDGKLHHYGVPYQWGPNVLMYNKDVFKTPPDSWSVVFEEQNLPDGKSNKGRVQAYAGPIYIADAALYLMSKQPDLGIKDPYSLDETQYQAALDLLRQQRQLVPHYWQDANAQVTDFTTESIVASSSWPFQVNLLQANGVPIGSVVPKEGATGWADTTMMYINSPHPNCAYKWLEHSLDPKVQGDVAAWFGSLPAVPEGCDASELLTKDGCKINGYENFDQIKFWRTPTTTCSDGHGDICVPYRRWTSDFTAIIGSR